MAVAGLLGATEREMGFGTDGRRIHVDNSRVQILNRGEGTVYVAGVNGGGQAVGYTVGNFDSLLQAVDGNH